MAASSNNNTADGALRSFKSLRPIFIHVVVVKERTLLSMETCKLGNRI